MDLQQSASGSVVLTSALQAETLNDQQVEQLLQEAEVRLRQASEWAAETADAPEKQDVIIVASVGRRKPYVAPQ